MGNENTVFTSTKLLFDAREGRLEGVRKAMKAADIDFDAQDPETGQTALIAACGCNVPEIVKLLLKKRIRIDTQDRYGLTALHLACAGGCIEIVELLLKKNAQLDLQDEDGHTPLHCASVAGHGSIIRLLLQAGANPEIRNKASHCRMKLVAASIAKDSVTRDAFDGQTCEDK